MLKNYRYIVGLVVACIALWLPSGNMNASEMTLEPDIVTDGTVDFVFFGTPLHAAIVQPVKVKSASEHDVFQAWRDYQRLDMSDALSSLNAISEDMNLNDKMYPPREIKSIISDAKNRLLTPGEWEKEAGGDFRNSLVPADGLEFSLALFPDPL